MASWGCTNCNSGKESWAERQSHKSNETYRRDIKCGGCDNGTLIYTDSQKETYKRLVKEKTSISGYVEEVERFSTWGSNNIATVLAYYDGYYRVFLLVYDPVYRSDRPAVFPESYGCNWGGEISRGRFSSLSSAKSEASRLRDKLISSSSKYYDNPILLIHPDCDRYHSFETFVKEPYVTKNYSTSFLKPFDVVKTHTTKFGFDFYHVGVYLGKIDEEFKVCHFTRDKQDTTIDSGSYFLDGKVVSYHPVIPFKNYRNIASQMVGAKDNNFRRNNYSLYNRNCEHFANMIVYGINFSDQIDEKGGRLAFGTGALNGASVAGGGAAGVIGVATSIAAVPATFGLSLLGGAASAVGGAAGITANAVVAEDVINANDCKKNINLEKEIRETKDRLGRKFDYETEKYEIKYLQVVPPKQECRIM